MLSDKRMTTVLLAIVGVLLALLIVVEMSGTGALAQQGGSTAGGATMAIITGEPSPSQDEPIFVVDSRNETVCIYEYNVGTRKFGLKAARSYKYDKELREYQNEPPTVDDVKAGRMRQAK